MVKRAASDASKDAKKAKKVPPVKKATSSKKAAPSTKASSSTKTASSKKVGRPKKTEPSTKDESSNEPGVKKDEKPKQTSNPALGHFTYKAANPMGMAMFAKVQTFSRVINIDAGCTVDIDTSAQAKSVTEVINIGPGSCVNIMTSGETEEIAQTINVGTGSILNIAVNSSLEDVADVINVTAGCSVNIVTAPVDDRCYKGHIDDREEAIRHWAAIIAASGMLHNPSDPGIMASASAVPDQGVEEGEFEEMDEAGCGPQ